MKLVSLENITKYNELLNKKIVKSVNSVKPDDDGNVTLGTEKSTFNKVEYDTGYFSIGVAQTYKFDLTGSDLENVSKENVNIRLVAKVVTAHNGFQVGDIAQLTTAIDNGYSVGNFDVCSYIQGNTLYLRSGNNPAFSIYNNDFLLKANVQIKAVLTAFIPSDGSILLIAEDQTNTSKLIGLPDGTLTWKDKNLVRSVNGVNADESGNVSITSVKYATSADSATKAIQDANGAQIDTTYFKSANGTFTGREYFRAVNDDVLRFNGGNTHDGGASLMLFGKNANGAQGVFDLVACTKEDASDSKQLVGTPAGALSWDNKHIVRSVNGALADGNGNVDVISHTIQNTNNFASTFLHNNNALKIQCVRISGNHGQQYGTVNWLVPFTDTNYHVFVTSEDTDTNLAFQFANVSLEGKTTTSCKVGHKVENTNSFFNFGYISVLGIGY